MARVRSREIEQAMKELKQIWRAIKSKNQVCMIPSLPGDPTGTCKLVDCHIIGESILALLARGGIVYEWPNDPTIRGHNAVKQIKAGNITELPGHLSKASPFTARGTGIGECTWRFACNSQDNRAFELIDKRDMDLDSNKVKFLLGFRAVVATAAWADSYSQFLSTDFLARPRIKRILRDYPETHSALPQFREEGDKLKVAADMLRANLSLWQDLYRDGPDTEYPIMASRRTAIPAVRSAGAGVPDSHDKRAITVTILPRSHDGQLLTRCDIVVVSLRPKSWLNRLLLRWKLYRVARRIKALLEKEPQANIPNLVGQLSFYYVAPDDFDNDTILSDVQRQAIHEKITSPQTPSQPWTPELP